MSLLVDTPSVGLEEIQRGAFYVLFDTLNDAIIKTNEAWLSADQSFAVHTGRPFVATELESVLPDNFVDGHRPSLIDAPIENYPNVSVMAYRAVPAPGTEQYDHQEKYRVNLVVETMVKATEAEGAEMCSRRAKRMVQAVNTCLMNNPTLGGMVSGFDGTPTVSVTELFTKKDRGGDASSRGSRASYGPEWFWQGGRLEYVVRKEAGMPTHGNDFRAPTYEGLQVDQI
jgi:hypothetical protein